MVRDFITKPLILASASPRRARLLSLVGLEFETRPSHLDEEKFAVPEPEKHVLQLSRLKAEQIAETIENGIVLGADTVVVLDDVILEKPVDEKDARRILKLLGGRFHQVYTGFTLVDQPSARSVSDFDMTWVHFRELSEREIDDYVASGSPMDKAGAYGIQDSSAIFVDRIEGCFYNVVGFPLAKFYETLEQFTIKQQN